MASGSWALAEELYARGAAAFVAELRRIHDADRLGKFAARWLNDRRPAARRLLIEYLAGPLNAYRHEALVKRLFKGAEAAGEDELMGVFLVAFDRSIRRVRRTAWRRKWDRFATRAEAESHLREWESQGFSGSVYQGGQTFFAHAQKQEEVVAGRQDTMPRALRDDWPTNGSMSERFWQYLERRFLLFSQPTRRYLRRRAWRYFRKLGKINGERYRAAATMYLKRYTDSDVDSDIHLLDNWGLVHTLFGDCAALIRPAKGWQLAPGKTLADLVPAPRFAEVWTNAPEALLELLLQVNCRTVRQWAAWMLRAHQTTWLLQQSAAKLLELVDHADPDVAALGFDMLQQHPDLASIPVEAWLARLDGDDLDKLERLSSLLARRLDPTRLALGEIVKLAVHRSLPVARLGLTLLQHRIPFGAADERMLLALVQVECATLRPEVASWLRNQLLVLGPPRAEWLLEFLDSKHADVRALGWKWLGETPIKDEPAIWHKLLESPYDDMKELIVAELARRSAGADLDTVRLLWASVLLNIQRGGRYKPGVVGQVVARLSDYPEESERLLPLLAIAVRSLRGPEFRAGLAGVVGLLERNASLAPAFAKQFPELVVG
jgi:hypothetical protein